MALPLKKIVMSCVLALSLSAWAGEAMAVPPLILPPTLMTGFCGWIYTPFGPVYISQCGGTFSATNIQWQQDIGWLGQVFAAASDAIQTQEQADQTADGKQITQQDKNLAATQKEQNSAKSEQEIAKEYPSATIKLPDGGTLQPTIPNACESNSTPGVASIAGATIAVANAAANSFLDQGALTAADVSADRKWDNGDHNGSLSAALDMLANDDNVTSLSAMSNLLEPDMTGVLANANAMKYIQIVDDPTPPPQLSKYVQNTPDGKMYLAAKRSYDADMSLANAALFFVANNDAPTISIGTIAAEMTAETKSGSSTGSTSSTTSNATGDTASASVTAAAASAAVTAATSSAASEGQSCGSKWNTDAGTEGHISTNDANAIQAAHNMFPSVSRRILAAINMHEGSGTDAKCAAGACGGWGERATFVANICSPHYGSNYSGNAAVCGGVLQKIHLITPGNWEGGWAYNEGADKQPDQIDVQQQAYISAANIVLLQRAGGSNPAKLAIGYGDSTTAMKYSGAQLQGYINQVGQSSVANWIPDYMVYLTAFYHCPYSLSATSLPNGYGPNTIADAEADDAGGTDWPAPGEGASMPNLTVSPSAPGFIKDLLRISQNQGVAGYASVNTLLEAYSEGYFLSPTWYASVAKNAGNPAFYNKTVVFMNAIGQEMHYLQARTNQYKTALLAQMYALKVREDMGGKLNALRAAATEKQ